MINFLKKIRKGFLTTGRTTKYLTYAIGEIILVVIGILIALAINNASETRKEQKLEQQLITRLHKEYQENKDLLTKRVIVLIQSEDASLRIMNLMNKDISQVETNTIDSLLFHTIEYSAYNPLSTTLTEVTQTGKLDLISNQKLKDLLGQWSIQYNHHQGTFRVFEKWVEDGILPYLTKNIASKNVGRFGQLQWKEISEFESDYNVILKDREFENIMDNHLYHNGLLISEYQNLDNIIDQILILTKEDSPADQ
ncbi:DUF6090 family protein [Nonlabens marinus]|uniref:Uncharacterized protein n=1 Tax=Nonlabens marinus S1-08 TaxID=1454201 RepID=W8VT54_9FLAO|nr:DUF6090 family protein [Nonlabens marinus]BAO56775.1 hypothetical protein NMS_2766 [Nonlabens marinus S1-08]